MVLPRHIVVIPDGNRRWAKKQGLRVFLGHEEGAKRLEEILSTVLELGIPYFTFWGSSLDNITKRSKEEVAFLFKIFESHISKLLEDKRIEEERVKISFLGQWKKLFPKNLIELFQRIERKTENNQKYHLTFLMAYSGTDEMKNAIEKISKDKLQNPSLIINEKTIKESLWTHDLPPVDLVIRTGGESHWSSGLMMWDVADAQLYFTQSFWPDFRGEELKKAIKGFKKTERRFGG